MKIAVLGSGPSGLMAAEAAGSKVGRNQITIISTEPEVPSVIQGAQYIHEPIPDVTNDDPDASIFFHKTGTAAGYAAKVYGSSDAPTSWNLFPEGEQPCWSLRDAYKRLYDRYKGKMLRGTVDEHSLGEIAKRFDLVISSIPAYSTCLKRKEHSFPRVDVRFERSDNLKDYNLGENFVYYSGSPIDRWYRASMIFDIGWYEYPAGQVPTSGNRHIQAGFKPLDTDCDCHPSVIRVGRFGEWKKGKLVHHAYHKTLDALEVVGAL